MSRRVTLPGASELFRSTDGNSATAAENPTGTDRAGTDPNGADPNGSDRAGTDRAASHPRGSGRVRHDEKITVYVSSDELLALEQTRLTLRARHGMAIDRGRIVREAMSAILADFDAHGVDSELVRRLSDS